MRTLLAIAIVVWAIGTGLHEGLQQGAAGVVMLVGVVAWWRGRVTLDADLKRFAIATLVLGAWEAITPGLALLRGIVDAWPDDPRYGQMQDRFAPLGMALAAGLGVPWVAVSIALVVTWTASMALGVWQHREWLPQEWSFPLARLQNTPEWRVHQVVSADGQPARYAGGGFFAHRLRFAHGALALAGLVLGRVFAPGSRRLRIGAALFAVVLATCVYVSFARAALGALVGMIGLAALLFARGRTRYALLAAAIAFPLVLAMNPTWQGWARHSVEHFDSERARSIALGVGLVKRHPIVGVGFGNHLTVAMAEKTDPPPFALIAHNSHSIWLTQWVETGIVGVLLLLWWEWTLGIALWRRLRAGSWVATGAFLAFVAFHALGLVHHTPAHSSAALTFAFVWGLGLAAKPEGGTA